MKKKKKMKIITIIGLIIISISIPKILYLLHKTHDITYTISNNDIPITIHETFSKEEGYYIEITKNNEKWEYIVPDQFKKSKQIIKNIELYESDQFQCIFPIFKGNTILFDISCIDNNTITYYHNLRGKESGLDQFAQQISETIYPYNNWVDNTQEEKKLGSITLYPENTINNHYVGTMNYKGVLSIQKDIKEIPVFNKDIYNIDIKGVYNQYILLPNYNDTYTFRSFYLIDIINQKQKEIKSHYDISFDSYIQGNIDNNFYLVDISNRKQYKIDIKNLEIELVGTNETGFQFFDGTMQTIPANQAINKKMFFSKPILSMQEYEHVDLYNSYYYGIEKEQNQYNVYRINVKNTEYRTYLFSIPSITPLKYIEDYVYFQNGEYIYIYHDQFGVKKILRNTEFSFNDTLFYTVTKK